MTDPSTYFIGLALPPRLSEQIALYKLRLHNEITHSFKPLVPHITLLHPSSLRSVPAHELLPKIRELAALHLPLTFSLGSIEDFNQTILYIRIDSPEIEILQRRLVELLPLTAQEGYHRRGYIPHITLAQARIPHVLDCASLYRRSNQEISLPLQASADAISCFTKVGPREYHTAII